MTLSHRPCHWLDLTALDFLWLEILEYYLIDTCYFLLTIATIVVKREPIEIKRSGGHR